MGELWNINIHYDATLDTCVPTTSRSVLDVGCGDGFLAARLSRRIPDVVALDVDEPVLSRARARFADRPITWSRADVMSAELGTFDAVVSNAMLHHLDASVALPRLGGLIRPGGVLAVVTFPRMEWRDLPWGATAFVARGIAIRARGTWKHSAPISWPPPDTLRQLRAVADTALPGGRVSRLLYGRCLIRWTRPR